MSWWNKLSGYRTQIGFIAAGVLGICYGERWIDEQAAVVAASLILAWTGVAAREALRKLEP